jgi:hypothetical protein
MHDMQRTHGNRSVQRQMSSAPAVPVQRSPFDYLADMFGFGEQQSGVAGTVAKLIGGGEKYPAGVPTGFMDPPKPGGGIAGIASKLIGGGGKYPAGVPTGFMDPFSPDMGIPLGEYQPPTGLMDPLGPAMGIPLGEYQPGGGGPLFGGGSPFFNPTPPMPLVPSMPSSGPFYNPTPAMPSMPQMPQAGPFFNPTPHIPMPGINAPGPLPVGQPFTGGPAFEEYFKSILGKEPAKHNEKPRGHAYWKEDADKGNVEGGFSMMSFVGDIAGVNVSGDWLYGGLKSGIWDHENGGTREGTQASVGIHKGSYGKGGPVALDTGVGTAQGEASWGNDGFSFGATANLVEGALTLGNFGNKTDGGGNKTNESQMKFGLSAGVGLGARGHWGDSDKDGKSEYGFGFDYGPVSLDYKTEDPLRSGLGLAIGAIGGPGGVYAADKALEWLGGDTNYTDKAGEYGKAAYNAGAEAYKYGGELIDDAGKALSDGYGTVSQGLSDGYDTVSTGLSNAYDTAASYVPDVSVDDLDPRSWF